MEYNFKVIEKKWQKKWEEKNIFQVKESSKKKKFYVLEMFPYPSGSGLHMGHALNYTIGDIFARFKRMLGFNVLYPMGYDALGLPAENAAIKNKIHPEEYTKASMKNFMKQQKMLGLSYDWSRLINTSSPDYYKWDQWIFLKMLEKGLAYQKEASVNWCPSCKTVLANEQAQTGNCERCKSKVEIKTLKQWFLKITDYADELLDKLDDLDWPQRTKAMQKNWIGKSYGTEIDFEIVNPDREKNKEKVILVDAVFCLVDEKGNVNKKLKKYLDSLPNKKIVLTNAPLEKYEMYFRNIQDYEIFTLQHKPNKKNNDYYKIFLEKNNLKSEDVLYFEHDEESMKSAESIEIRTFHYKDNFENIKEFIENNLKQKFPIFTTRPDTIFGVTFMVISAQHPKLFDLVTDKQKKEVENFLKKLKGVSEKNQDELDKQGVFTGSYAINPVTKDKVPIYAGNFVVADYGSGMVMAVPAHDQRDFLFAKKYEIPIKVVIDPIGEEIEKPEKMTYAYTEKGNLINSGEFNNLENEKAKEEITKYLIKNNLGRKKINFKLRDWLISRQRYWGTPIPIVYCKKCGVIPIDEKNLPVKLPKDVKFGEGNPLETSEKWIKTKCPKCNGNARRETDTMDTFVNSSWYFSRYCDPQNEKEIFDKKKVKYWCPVDQYIGGAEHACMHLIYSRFYTKFLRDIGLLNFDEPFTKLFHQGMLHGSDGNKMSKSLGNTTDPIDTSEKYGSDSLRLALMSFASPDTDTNWDEKVLIGSYKFLIKVKEYFEKFKISKKLNPKIESKLNKIIKEVTNQIENFKYNLAIIKVRELFSVLFNEVEVSREVLEKSLKLLHPFCPHITEELWEKLGNKDFISLSEWPVVDEKKIDENLEKQEQLGENLISDIININKIIESKGETKKSVYVYVLPNEKSFYSSEEISKRVGKDVKIFAVNDKDKYDPNNISKKAKPGKPGIYFE
jgi:leucyl-tRNA synthetase